MEDIPVAPKIEDEKYSKGCILIFHQETSGKEISYCILPEDIVKKDKYYVLPSLNINIDKISYKQILLDISKAFVTVRKTSDYYVLRPIKSDEKKLYEYETHKELGKGGQGVVDVFPTEKIVVKRMKQKELTPEIIREIAIYSYFYKISCIPSLLNFDVETLELTLELGKSTIYGVIETLTPKEKRIIGFRLIKCMKLIASQGIIHNDIKPENCIISQEGLVKLIDWGFAEIDTTIKQTKPKIFSGTADYQSYEVLLEKQYTYKSDIFAIGLILYYMHTGGIPVTHCNDIPQILFERLIKLLGVNSQKPKKTTTEYMQGGSVANIIKARLMAPDDDSEETQAHSGFPFDEDLADLLSKMLEFNPNHRIGFDEILIHPYFQYIKREKIGKIPIFINNLSDIKTIDNKIRATEFQKLYVICKKFELRCEILCYTIQIFDEYMSKNSDSPDDIIASAFFLADRLSNDTDLEIKHICEHFKVSKGKIILNSKKILKALHGNIAKMTFYSYWSHFYGDSKYKNTHMLYPGLIGDMIKIYLAEKVYETNVHDLMKKIKKERQYMFLE